MQISDPLFPAVIDPWSSLPQQEIGYSTQNLVGCQDRDLGLVTI
jgi:hypothetical protein